VDLRKRGWERYLWKIENVELAEFYLKAGYAINEQLFRRVDNSFITGDIADLNGLSGNARAYLKTLEDGRKKGLRDRSASTGS